MSPLLAMVQPAFTNPYPDDDWRMISNFVYLDPLILYRHTVAVEIGGPGSGRTADFIVGLDYRVKFDLDGVERTVTVPKGMTTDLASVPRVFRSIVGQVGPHLEAAIVHDFLYIAWQDVPNRGARDEDRNFADRLFLRSMRDAGMSWWEAHPIYMAVDGFGGSTYRERDEPRYVDIPDL